MTSFENHAQVQTQIGQQHFHGPVSLFGQTTSDHGASHTQVQSDGIGKDDNDILSSLSFPEMLDRRSNIEQPLPGSCDWILSHENHQRMIEARQGFLWIKGKPGSGKSTVMAFLYDELSKHHRSADGIYLDFFFNGRGSELQRTPIGMLRSLVNQIFACDPLTRPDVRDLYGEKTRAFGKSPSTWTWQRAELQTMLEKAVLAAAQRKTVSIFVDALDEAGESAARELATFFHQINDRLASSSSAKIYISCRHFPIPSLRSSAEIFVEEHNGPSIATFVHEDLFQNQMLDTVLLNTAAVQNLAAEIIEKANGIFQWVRLITPLVSKSIAEGEAFSTLQQLIREAPQDLADVYAYIFKNVIGKTHYAKTLQLFQWVCLAERPLTVSEFEFILTIETQDLEPDYDSDAPDEPDDTPSVSTGCDTEKYVQMTARIKTWSGGLVEVVQASKDKRESLQVIHQSVNDYVVNKGLRLLEILAGTAAMQRGMHSVQDDFNAVPRSHAVLYRFCLERMKPRYLEYRLMRYAWAGKRRKLLNLFRNNLVLNYAAQNLFVHAEKAQSCRFIDVEEEVHLLQGVSAIRTQLCKCLNRVGLSYHGIPSTSLIHSASGANMKNIVRHLISLGIDVNTSDELGNTPVHHAAQHGHQEILALLIEHGAVPNLANSQGESPMALAAARGNTLIVARLLEAEEVALTASDSIGEALKAAAKSGEIKTVTILLKAHMDKHSLNEALQAAAEGGHANIAQLLLKMGAEVNSAESGTTALQAALENRGQEIDLLKTVTLLIEAGANPNIAGERSLSPLQAAAYAGHRKLLSLLLDAGAEVNQTSASSCDALCHALQRRHVDCAQKLIRAGVKVDRLCQHGTALNTASISACLSGVHLLLEAGWNPNLSGDLGQSPLHLVINSEPYGIYYRHRGCDRLLVKVLIDGGADINGRDLRNNTPLQLACYLGRTRVVKILLAEGADIDAEAGSLGTALEIGIASIHSQAWRIVELLLLGGAQLKVSISAITSRYLQNDHSVKMVQLLKAAGVDINSFAVRHNSAMAKALGAKSFGPWHQEKSIRLVKLLMENGVDVNRISPEWGTALQRACALNARTLARRILNASADIHVQAGPYGNALQAACMTGNQPMVRSLLYLGADVNAKGGRYCTALQAACYHGSAALVRMLLDAGAEVNSRGGSYGSALQVAAMSEKKEVIRMLMDSKVDITMQDGSEHALYIASEKGLDQIVLSLLKYGVDIDHPGGLHGTSLGAAANAGMNSTVALLVKAGADLNATGGINGTAIHTAVYRGHFAIGKLLLQAGADIHIRAGKFGSVLQASCCMRNAQPDAIVRLLLGAGAKVNQVGGKYGSALQAASCNGFYTVVQMLITAGAEVNAVGGKYGSALQAAFANWSISPSAHERIVRCLLDAGADVNLSGGKFGTPLSAAAYHMLPSMVRLLLDRGADVNGVYRSLGSALVTDPDYYAFQPSEQTYMTEMLLEAGADFDGVHDSDDTMLQSACLAENGQLVQLLVDLGADVNIARGWYGTALITAALINSTDCMNILLKAGANVNLCAGHYGLPLQASATRYGSRYETLDLLLQSGADVHAQGGFYHTALQAAAQNGVHPNVMRLLDAGANVNEQGGRYNTALQAAASNNHSEVVRALLHAGANVNASGTYETALIATAKNATLNCDVLKQLLAAKADINATDNSGRNALIAALDFVEQSRILESVDILLKAGVDVNVKGGSIDSALHAAVRPSTEGKPMRALLRMLLDAGADINLKAGPHVTVLQTALINLSHPWGTNEDIIRDILASGADVDARLKDGNTSLHAAISDQDKRVIKILLDAGASSSIANDAGQTPLHLAGQFGMIEVIDWLRQQNVEVNLVDAFNRTPLHMSLYGGQVEATRGLVSHGAQLDLRDYYGQSALDLANGDHDLKAWLQDLNSELKPTLPDQRAVVLRRSVTVLANRLIVSRRRYMQPGFEELGHCLKFLGEQSDACYSFQQLVGQREFFDPFWHTASCRRKVAHTTGGFIEGSRFVCQTCAGVSLCTHCMKKYQSGATLPLCVGHEFLEVEFPTVEDDQQPITETLPESTLQWLKDLIDRYETAGANGIDPNSTYHQDDTHDEPSDIQEVISKTSKDLPTSVGSEAKQMDLQYQGDIVGPSTVKNWQISAWTTSSASTFLMMSFLLSMCIYIAAYMFMY